MAPFTLLPAMYYLDLDPRFELGGGGVGLLAGLFGECCLGPKISFTTLLSQWYGSWLHDIFLIATRVSGLQSEPLVAFLTVLEWHGHT